MIKINVITNNISWHHFIKNPNNYIEKKINKLNAKDKIFAGQKIYCTLLLSGNKEIRYLNKKFRNKDKVTDILSFPFHLKKELRKLLKTHQEIYLGDIIINLNEIKEKNAKSYKTEFDRLWIHGLVHLFGHDHKREKDFLKMSKIEKNFINIINA